MTDKPTPTDAVALARYKVVPAHESMFHRFAVVAGDGKQQLYLGREVECENMARKFAGAFLDGAFYQANITPSTQAAGSVPAVEREQERIAFKDAHRHLELDEAPDAWGRPMFKHSHVEASWLGWIARASHGQAPATQQAGVALSEDLRDRLVAISEAIADQDDRAAQAMLREILKAPTTSSMALVAESVQEDAARLDFMVNTGEHYCHSIKTNDSNSPARCIRCDWTGERQHLVAADSPVARKCAVCGATDCDCDAHDCRMGD